MVYQKKFMAVVKSEDGKILRESGDTVYIPFNSEYSLQFKNLNSRKAVISVEIDGEDVLGGRQLIIEANESINLERFLGDNLNEGHKFKFIQKIKEIQEHRGDRIDDGFIRVTFQYEKPPIDLSYFNGQSTIYRSPTNAIGKWQDSTFTSNNSNDVQWNNNSVLRSRSVAKGVIPEGAANHEVTMDWFDVSSNNTATPQDFSLPAQDEGITVKGSNSTQSFKRGHIGALEAEKHTLVLRVKGFTSSGNEVVEPLTVKTKLECSSCGKTSDSSNKFCSRCGTALI